jgi:tetratricopeptide (TPR) repeat protein
MFFLRANRNIFHSYATTRCISQGRLSDIQPFLTEATKLLSLNGNKQLALEKLSQASSLAHQFYKDHPPSLCNILSGIAAILANSRLLEESRPYLKQCLDHLPKELSTSSQQDLNIHINIASTYFAYNELENADIHYSKAIPFYKFDNTISHAFTLNRVCAIKTMKTQSADGVKYCEESARLYKTLPGHEIDVCFTLDALAQNYRDLKQFEKAIETINECLSITKKSKDPKVKAVTGLHYKTLTSIYGHKMEYVKAAESALAANKALKGVESDRNRLNFMMKTFQNLRTLESLDIMIDDLTEVIETALGKTDETFEAFDSMATALLLRGKAEKSLNVAEKCLKLRKEAKAESSIAKSYMLIAKASLDLRQLENAYQYIGLLESALQGKMEKDMELEACYVKFRYELTRENNEAAERLIEEYIRRSSDASLLTSNQFIPYGNFGNFYRSISKNQEALDAYQKALSIYNENIKDLHPEKAILYDNIGHVNISLNKPTEAIDYLMDAVEMKLKLWDEHNINLLHTYKLITRACFIMNDFQLAMEFVDKNMNILKKNNAENSSEMALAYAMKGEIFEYLMKKDSAKEAYIFARDIANSSKQKELSANIEVRLNNLDK